MKYIEYVNSIIADAISKPDKLVLFGQNINAGSCLGGLTKGLKVKEPGRIINTPNSENTQVGVGFGLMLNGISSIFFMKQQDFLLLGIDQLVNTYNIIRTSNPPASFTIMPVVVDSGYEGPQSALNNFSDFCSIANVEGYSFTNKIDTEAIIRRHLIKPGFRIIGVSQRLMKQNVLELELLQKDENGNFFQYSAGKELTIVCFNYSLPYGLELKRRLGEVGRSISLFSVNTYSEFDFGPIIDDLRITGKVLIMDDSKSANQLGDRFLSRAREHYTSFRVRVVRRMIADDWFYPSSDELKIDYDDIIRWIMK
jgi:pyruvate/2-oxoglutarate/acetoin dehydrogenase E1 component